MIRLINSRLTVPCMNSVQYNYIRKKDIEQIRAKFGDSNWQKVRMFGAMLAHIGKQALKQIRNDANLYLEIKKKSEQQYSSEDWNNLIRIYHDFFRLGPLVIIQILPMSGPLFFLYMYTYPGSIPSWFIIDEFHENYEKKIRKVQQEAIQYFKKKGSKPADIDFNKMSLQQTRRLAECLYGYHRDGTLGLKKIFKREVSCFISEGTSKYLIKRKLKYKFNADLQHKNILGSMNFYDKVQWKYQQVMVHGKLLKKYEDTLTPEQFRIRQQTLNWSSELSQISGMDSSTKK